MRGDGRFTVCSALYFGQFPCLAFVPQRREDTRFQNFRLGFDPVFDFPAFDLPALIVKLARAQPYFSFQQFQHQFLPFTRSGYAIHFNTPQFNWSTSIVDGEVLQGREEGGY